MDNLRLATVKNVTDILKEGTVICTIPSLGGDYEYSVKYTSPYLNHNTGGFVAIPEVGSRILVCKPEDGTNQWYYLTTVVGTDMQEVGDNEPDLTEVDYALAESNKNYAYVGAPQTILIKSPGGHALRISDAGNNEQADRKIELESGGLQTGTAHVGKKVSLNDSPEINAITIQDGSPRPSFLRIFENYGTVVLEAENSAQIISREADLELLNIDGREILIKNKATGKNAIDTGSDTSPGNIRVESDFGDIIISTNGRDGSIFIETNGSQGSVNVVANGDINVTSQNGTINIVGPNISIGAAGTQTISLNASRIDFNKV